MDFCIIHGYTLRYDFRSGFDICDHCEAAKTAENVINEAISHLRCALSQSIPGDDQIIIGHIRSAAEVLEALRGELKHGHH
jgi:hypothetical protein